MSKGGEKGAELPLFPCTSFIWQLRKRCQDHILALSWRCPRVNLSVRETRLHYYYTAPLDFPSWKDDNLFLEREGSLLAAICAKKPPCDGQDYVSLGNLDGDSERRVLLSARAGLLASSSWVTPSAPWLH